jgi:hypothetical protein
LGCDKVKTLWKRKEEIKTMRTGKIAYVKIQPSKPYQYALMVLLLLFVWLNLGSCSSSSGSLGTGISSDNFSNQWNYKFHYLAGEVQGEFTAQSDSAQLIYSSNLEKGTIDFQLYNSKDSLLRTFSAKDTTDVIKGIFIKGEQYRVKAIVTKAKGSFDFKME